MRRVRCPECDEKVKVPDDHDRSTIRCSSCNEKIPLDDDDAPRKSSVKKKSKSVAKTSGKPSFLATYGFPLGSLAAVLFIAFVLLVGSLFHEGPALAAFVLGPTVALFAFIVACVLASREGHYIPFLDFLGTGPGLAIVLLILFFGCYVSLFLLFWTIAIVKSTIHRPKVYLPWLAVNVLGVLIMFGIPIIHSFAKQAGMVYNSRRPDPGPIVQEPPRKLPPIDKKDGPIDKNGEKKDKEPVKVEKPLPPPPPRVTGDAKIDRALADLKDKDREKYILASDALSKMQPNQQHRAIVAQRLAEQLPNSTAGDRTPLLRALGVWGTAKEVPPLIQMINDKDTNTCNEAMDALGKLRDPRAAGPLIRNLSEFRTAWHAENSLKVMGPAAEKEVLALLYQKNDNLKHVAFRVLKDIGTQQSVPAMQAALKGPFQDSAREVLKAIAARAKK